MKSTLWQTKYRGNLSSTCVGRAYRSSDSVNYKIDSTWIGYKNFTGHDYFASLYKNQIGAKVCHRYAEEAYQ
jgi:hypothetical protein